MEVEQYENKQKLTEVQIQPTISIYQAHQNAIETIAANPNGNELASGSHDHLIKLWDVEKGKQQLQLQGHKEGVWSVVYSPDGRELLSGSCDSTLMIWDLKKAKPAKTLQGHKNKIYWAKYNENASLIASGGQLSPVIIWDMKTGGILKQIENKSMVTYCVEWSKDGNYLATTQMDGTLNIYDSKTFELVAKAPGDLPVESRAYGCDLDFVNMPGKIYVATEQKYIKEFEFKDKHVNLVKKHFAHFDAVKSLTLDGAKKLLVSTGRDGSVRLWSAQGKLNHKASLIGHQQNVSKAVFVPGKQTVIASSGWDQRINIWKLKS